MSSRPVRILLVEDNPGDVRLAREALRDAGLFEYDLTHVERLGEAEEVFAGGEVDVVLLDLSLPDANGVESVTRTYDMAPTVPIVVLTGLDDESAAIASMQAGAQDYLVKGGVDGSLLARSIRYAIERKHLEREHERLRHQLELEHERLRFLADAGIALAESLDYEETLESVARLAVQSLADYCIIDIVEETGEIRRLQVAHADPASGGLAARMRDFPLDRSRAHISAGVLEGEPAAVVRVTPDMILEHAQNEEHLEILRELRPRSYLTIPLRARDRLLGALVLVSSTRDFSNEDLRFAEELARRAALAVDDARLYRQAQQVIRARDEVLRIVSHDLRNPLSTITMSVEILQDAQVNFSEEQKLRQLQVVLRSAERMDRLIGDLLDVARLEAGQLSLETSHTEPRRLVDEALELHMSLALARSLTLTSDVVDPLPPVLADRDRVLQVLGNLIGNAIKFTPEGGEITIRAEPHDEMVRFSVTDTGPGIPEQQLAQLFRPFWQGRRGGRDGAGLGLAVSKGIVEAHEGTIWAESELGSGTSVLFTLKSAPERRGTAPREHAAAD